MTVCIIVEVGEDSGVVSGVVGEERPIDIDRAMVPKLDDLIGTNGPGSARGDIRRFFKYPLETVGGAELDAAFEITCQADEVIGVAGAGVISDAEVTGVTVVGIDVNGVGIGVEDIAADFGRSRQSIRVRVVDVDPVGGAVLDGVVEDGLFFDAVHIDAILGAMFEGGVGKGEGSAFVNTDQSIKSTAGVTGVQDCRVIQHRLTTRRDINTLPISPGRKRHSPVIVRVPSEVVVFV